MFNPQNPLIIQSNSTILLEVNNPLFVDARNAISQFAHLDKSPEYIHTYTITALSLWNAAALGLTSDEVLKRLEAYSKYPLPQNVAQDISELMGRFGKITLESVSEGLAICSQDTQMLQNLCKHPMVKPLLGKAHNQNSFLVPAQNRGLLKQVLISIGYPAHDKAGYVDGDPFPIDLRSETKGGEPFNVRTYQHQAAENFIGNKESPGGSGVVVLPCGAGKTIVGILAMSLLKRRTLILVTNVTAARQWRREILDKTTIDEKDIGEYSGELKEIKPVTLATYQILTYRRKKSDIFVHYDIFNSENWGLILYDEVHLLPAPIFKFTADIQARRRLGLTATLIREDGHENDVFTLIGPKKFDMPWKDLEKQGWIACATCVEIRIDLPAAEKMRFLSLTPKQQIRLAYENPNKLDVIEELIETHKEDQVLIIGQYISQLEQVATRFNTAIITGATPNKKREELFNAFRAGEIKVLVLSKVGNFAIDLPDANIAIQISGSFGSRQEEAQRLGRILRPKKKGEQATFYSIVTRESKELDFAMNRQLFLTEQGYSYEIQYRESDN
ncbi:DEAD/DEAH box helicase [Chitinispirillales bacterium ANBcel5]|uniref:DNA repair helicase XPB n=1 Tax=Cellulosispirillum alkaliphilum TaxID=3039283 RepID=UPI002A540DFC|nr:DEAD/DEAH box helicase [Chitinispirillales bacterium ANBcel5]